MDKEPVYKGKICPITDGTCPRDCGYGAHATITRARKNIINRLSIPVDPAEANICDGCE